MELAYSTSKRGELCLVIPVTINSNIFKVCMPASVVMLAFLVTSHFIPSVTGSPLMNSVIG